MKCAALVGCEEQAQFWVNFHNCDDMLICEQHLNQWLGWVEETEAPYWCWDCRKTFDSVPRFLEWRFVGYGC